MQAVAVCRFPERNARQADGRPGALGVVDGRRERLLVQCAGGFGVAAAERCQTLVVQRPRARLCFACHPGEPATSEAAPTEDLTRLYAASDGASETGNRCRLSSRGS